VSNRADFAGPKGTMRTTIDMSSKFTFYSQSQLYVHGWRAFLIDFLCGVIAITWYLLARAEKITLCGLTRLEKIAARPSGYFPIYRNASKILLHGDESVSSLLSGPDHDGHSPRLRSFDPGKF
jgi:hypothetical protein